jgi:two-component system response regulator HydG
LENAIERAVVLSKSRTLTHRDFSFLKTALPEENGARSLLDIEKRHIKSILVECDWNISQAARILDIDRSTLHKKINKFGLRK